MEKLNLWKKDEMVLGGYVEQEKCKASEINYVRLTTFSSLTEVLDSSHIAAFD